MPIVYIILIGLSLSMDAFSVCLSVGACRKDSHLAAALRMGSVFGFFQFIMPIFGYFLGYYILRKFSPYDQWIASVVLICIGLKMLKDSKREEQCSPRDITKGLALLFLAIATSIDALSVGIGIAVANISIMFFSSVVGFVTLCMCLLGVYFGRALGFLLGRWACVFGGLVICIVGLKMLFL